MPRPKCHTQWAGVFFGIAREILIAEVMAPMAFISEMFWATNFQPVEYPLSTTPDGQGRKEWLPSFIASVAITKWPLVAGITAASSPGPITPCLVVKPA